MQAVSPELFPTLGIAVVEGRDFTAASWAPAWRAARVDPAASLRDE